ncbi:hypothetical protein D9757_004353 [Collybiopsis confluens]|uniref:non-specific serine/threonine protein kinase n=1 Tax=Collybiopsis confluens TaxID=2823264 RepID=A0A8H5MD12_9AGAR|nr:hypothetical protein D9757_004353 [Collybiopsis confluens]
MDFLHFVCFLHESVTIFLSLRFLSTILLLSLAILLPVHPAFAIVNIQLCYLLRVTFRPFQNRIIFALLVSFSALYILPLLSLSSIIVSNVACIQYCVTNNICNCFGQGWRRTFVLTGGMLSPSQDGKISSLAALSRNASVISSSSSSDSIEATPPRPRPLRAFSSPRSPSLASPISRSPRPPSYLPKELAVADDLPKSRAASKVRSKSRAGELSIDDFDVGEALGEGSYSTVLEATLRKSGKKYAIKVLDKMHLAKKNKGFTVKIERAALIRLGRQHPGLISLYWTFQDEYSLYFVLDLATNGEMQSLLSRIGSLSLRCSQYYMAQMVDAIGDLKPENLLLDFFYRLKIADFGTAKVLNADFEAERFVGTAQYVAPELVVSNESSESSDLWALGCVLYQMISGRFAFSGLSEYLTLQKVKQVDYTFPEGFDEDAKDLVEKLLVRDPVQRLGSGGPGSLLSMQALRSHTFFNGVDWANLWTDSPPPIEAGLLTRQVPLTRERDRNWDNAGEMWDTLALDDDNDGVTDGIDWDRDAEGSSLLLRQRQSDATQSQTQPVEHTLLSTAKLAEEGPTSALSTTASQSYHRLTAGSPSSGSPESSSEGGGSVERIAAGVQNMRPFQFPLDYSEKFDEGERGRSQAPTPIQGNTLTEVPSTLNPQPHEVVLHWSIVEKRSTHRRASRLLKPIAGAQTKSKARDLILTNLRLICVKSKRSLDFSSVKSELFFKVTDEKEREKRKEVKDTGVLLSAECREGREFVVISSAKIFHYAAQDTPAAAAFVEKINRVISMSKR